MAGSPVILCPTDFSDASAAAVRYAHAIAAHTGARLLIVTVEDRLLAEARELHGGPVSREEEARRELAHFVKVALGAPAAGVEIDFAETIGRPAEEILRAARTRKADVIVMSSHGATRMRRLFFGSTTERVLRDTTVPVLVTPPDGASIQHGDLRSAIRRVLVPVDLSAGSLSHLQAARGICEALRIPLLVTHVVEPVRPRGAARVTGPSLELERKTRAEDALSELIATLPRRLHPEGIVAIGDPAEEIAKVARDRDAGLVVMGLHASPPGRHIGSVTYRVLCLSHALVLALPGPAASAAERAQSEASVAV